jgi:hypothetical protein
MKKTIIAFASLLLSVNMFGQVVVSHPRYKEYFKESIIKADVAFTFGSVGYSSNIIEPVFGGELTFRGFMMGFTLCDGGYVEGAKTVHVSGYTKSNGTYVSSYNRRAPGRSGGGRDFNPAEIYFGYYLPCFSYDVMNYYVSPIVGGTLLEVNNPFTYGAAIKLIFVNSYCGVTLHVTNNAFKLGLSISMI